jgi:hypothetical protein
MRFARVNAETSGGLECRSSERCDKYLSVCTIPIPDQVARDYLNFFGDELIGDYWKENQPLNKKLNLVFQKLKITSIWAERHYQSNSTLTRAGAVTSGSQRQTCFADAMGENRTINGKSTAFGNRALV